MIMPMTCQGLMEANGDCARRWKIGGCVHCPSWSEIGEIWKTASERRRCGGFTPLSPSNDAEWSSYLPNPTDQPLVQRLVREWVGMEEGMGVEERWDAMLCDAHPGVEVVGN